MTGAAGWSQWATLVPGVRKCHLLVSIRMTRGWPVQQKSGPGRLLAHGFSSCAASVPRLSQELRRAKDDRGGNRV
jgi:hypothetical protein